MTEVKVTGQSTVGQTIANDVNKAVHSLDELKSKGAAAANSFAQSMTLTSKEASALGRAVGLTAGEVRKMVAAEKLGADEARQLAQAQIKLEHSTRSVKEAANVAASGIEKLNAVMGALGITALGLKVFDVFKSGMASAIAEAQEANQVLAQTEAVIRSTGGAAGFSAPQIAAMADSLSKLTGIEDDAIQATENMLLTFRNVKGDVFREATLATLDMSVALGKDGVDSAVMLGKALNDPIKGITALTRVGVTFTEQQRSQIAAMVDAGDVAGAQRVILTELNAEFGGSAGAAAGAAGGMRQFDLVMGEIAETAGQAVLPAINRVAESAIPGLERAAAAATPVLEEFANRFGGVVAGALETSTAVDKARHQFAASSDGLIEYTQALEDHGQATKGTADAMRTMEAAGQDISITYGGLAAEFQLVTAENIAASNAAQEHTEALRRLASQGAAPSAGAVEDLQAALDEITSASKRADPAIMGVVRALQNGKISSYDANQALSDLGATADDVTLAEHDLAQAQKDAEQASRDATKALQDQLKTQKDLAGIAADLTGEFADLGSTFLITKGALPDLSSQVEDLTGKFGDMYPAVGDVANVISEATGKMQGMTDLMLNDFPAAAGGMLEGTGSVAQGIGTVKLSAEDMMLVGESFLKFMDATGNSARVSASAYDTLREKYGLATGAQIDMEHGLALIDLALDTNQLNAQEAAQVFEDWVTGSIKNIGDLETKLAELTAVPNPMQPLVDRMGEADAAMITLPEKMAAAGAGAAEGLDPATTAVQETIDKVGEIAPAFDTTVSAVESAMPRMMGAIKPFGTALDSFSLFFKESPAQAKGAFDAISKSLQSNFEVWGTAGGMLDGMAASIKYLVDHPNIKIKINVETTGDPVPPGGGGGGGGGAQSGGGSDFVTSGEMNLKVGDNPGGRERVIVQPLSGMGQTKGIPGGMSFAGGTGGLGGSFSIGQLILPGVQNAADFFDDLVQEARMRGLQFSEMS